MTNKHAREGLIDIYGNQCMYGGIVTPLNKLTYHHCFRRNGQGGKATLQNGSVAGRLEHSGIHILSEDSRWWDKKLKEYIREYKSLLKPNMTASEFVLLKIVQEMRAEIKREMEARVQEMEYEEYITKDRHLDYRKIKRRYK